MESPIQIGSYPDLLTSALRVESCLEMFSYVFSQDILVNYYMSNIFSTLIGGSDDICMCIGLL